MSDAVSISWWAGVCRAGLFLALWLVLTGLDPGGLVFGGVAVVAASALSLRLLPPARGRAPWRALPMLPAFFWRSLLGGIDVARRALDPRLPLAPAWQRVPARLGAGGRFLIGAEFSLMPGTLVAGCSGDCYLVHLLDARQPIAADIATEETRLRRALAGSGRAAPARDHTGPEPS